jgi:HAD superfamily hydrolase (TIGR01549 family)
VLYDDVHPAFERLNSQGVAIAVCSNLAKPYGKIVELLPPEIPVLKGLSYELGYIKPEPEIYSWILKTVGVDTTEALFIGDTFIADYEGSIKMGIPALHLTRKGSTMPHEISSLREII